MNIPTHNPGLRAEPIGLGHIAGICQSLGFDYMRVTNIWIDSDAVTVEEFDTEAGNLISTELRILRPTK